MSPKYHHLEGGVGLTCEEEEERRQRGTGKGGRVTEGGREGEREGQGRESEGGGVMKGERREWIKIQIALYN